jgi:TM2 domain-containing membrane protein YozV
MEILDNNGNPIPQQESKRILAGIMGILFGSFAIHKFILGYTKEGIIQIVANICTCGLATIIPFIEGIIYLSKSDQEFIATYQNNHKGWF